MLLFLLLRLKILLLMPLTETINSPQFVWTAHHAIYDGWCIPNLLEKVEACYRDLKFSLDTSAPYSSFIKYLAEIDTKDSDRFWKSKLSETMALQFPALPSPSYTVQATSITSHRAQVSREVGSHITLPSMIRAAWALVVGIYSGNMEDVVFGETLTGRDAPVPGIERMIGVLKPYKRKTITNKLGPTLATVPARIKINPETTIARFLEDVQSQSAEAIPYQYAGLQHIKHISEDTQIACGFQNLLAIHHDSQEDSDGFWDLRSSGTMGTNFYSYPLTVSCQVGENKVDVEAYVSFVPL